MAKNIDKLIRRNQKTQQQQEQQQHYYRPPNEDQLLNFVCVMIAGPSYSAIQREIVKESLKKPHIRDRWLNRHKTMQLDLLQKTSY